jgi:hypothetical protein
MEEGGVELSRPEKKNLGVPGRLALGGKISRLAAALEQKGVALAVLLQLEKGPGKAVWLLAADRSASARKRQAPGVCAEENEGTGF